MTEYTSSPAAIQQYRSARTRTADWVAVHTNEPNSFVSPSVPPSLIDDSDDGMSTPSDSDFSSHSNPPRMILKFPDGRPNVPVSETNPYVDPYGRMNGKTRRREPETLPVSSPYASAIPPVGPPPSSHPSRRTATRSRATSHPIPAVSYPSSRQQASAQPSSSTVLFVPPPAPQLSHHAPELIQVHPSQSSPYSPYAPQPPPDPYSQNSGSQRSRSHHSARSKRSVVNQQTAPMIYTPTHAPPLPSPARSTFSQQQPREIIAPSPVHAYANKPGFVEPQEEAFAPEPEVTPTPAAAEPSSHVRSRLSHSASGSTSRSHPPPVEASHHSRSGSESYDRRGQGPPPIVYAPSKHSSSSGYAYNPPVIQRHPPQSQASAVPMQRTPSQHPASLNPSHHSSHHSRSRSQPRVPPEPQQRSYHSRTPPAKPMEPSYSDPTHNRGRSGIPGSSKYYTTPSRGGEHSSRRIYEQSRHQTPSPAVHTRDGKLGVYMTGRGYEPDHRHSGSSGSTYYVIQNPGQKVTVVPAHGAVSYSHVSSHHASLPRAYADSSYPHPRSATVAPITNEAESVTPTVQSGKRPLLQRILHPQRHSQQTAISGNPESAGASEKRGVGFGSLGRVGGMAPAKLRRRLTER